jgi:penicillin-binding protein 2
VIEAPLQRRTPLPPQLTRRVGVLGVVAFVLFGVIAFRLWYLQILTGTQNAARATSQVLQHIAIPSPRGNILDSNGQVLATYRFAPDVAIVKDNLPAPGPGRRSVYKRLAHVLGMPWTEIRATVDDTAVAPAGFAPTTISLDVPSSVVAYLGERKRYYPGVVESTAPVRSYPLGDIGSVVLGEVGQISGPSPGSPGELGHGTYRGIAAGTIVGQSGLEAEYQPYLQGKPGTEQIEINASGYPTGAQPKFTAPVAGDQLETSLVAGVEREGYNAIRHAEAVVRAAHYAAPAGSFVAMSPLTGRVIGLGSLPTYDANEFSTGISTSQYKAIQADNADFDRAIDGLYPTGSTFKPITALAGLGSGLITLNTTQGSGSCYTVSNEPFCNSNNENDGDQNVIGALAVSEDTFFYPIGAAANGNGTGAAIQDEARAFGLGRSPGIDLAGGAAAGVVPDINYVHALNQTDAAQFCDGQGPGHHPKARYASDQLAITGCAQGYFENWTVGQDVQLATGQGMLEASPLQMAIAYSALFNGGRVWTPQIAQAILSPTGAVVQQLPPPTVHNTVPIDPAYQAAIAQGLHEAAQSTQGTSDATFGSFPLPVYGKTGTAQIKHGSGYIDDSWYVCYVPAGKRSIVVAVAIQNAGYGAAAAAPAARLILSQWFGVPKKFVAGTNPDL